MTGALLILKGLLTAAFLMAGGAKLAGAKPLADQFREFGLPLGLMRVIGVLEVAGAIGLWVKPFPVWAAAGLAGLMVGAVANHLKVQHPLLKAAPSIVLGLLCVLAAVGMWTRA
jgi:hypothetical protein